MEIDEAMVLIFKSKNINFWMKNLVNNLYLIKIIMMQRIKIKLSLN